MVLLHTGLRAGDAANLTWGEVDLENGFIRVLMEKTENIVTIPISNQLREVLLDHPTKENQIFDGLETDNKRQKVRERVKKSLRIAGFDPRRAGLHTFRHTFASRLVMKGVPLIQISKWLGHRDISMTQIYAHLEPTSGKEEINKIDFSPADKLTLNVRENLISV